jgi:CYTH domain-containing protein
VVVTDAPFLNTLVYAKDATPELESLVLRSYRDMQNLDFYLQRGEDYSPEGRTQTLQQAQVLDLEILGVLNKHAKGYRRVPRGEKVRQEIFHQVMQTVEEERKKTQEFQQLIDEMKTTSTQPDPEVVPEWERKWLLYRMPIFPEELTTQESQLQQYYTTNGVRYRKETIGKEINYYAIRKESLGHGKNLEYLKPSDEELFQFAKNNGLGGVEKTRYSWKDEEVEWFLDVLETGTLLLEIEFPTLETMESFTFSKMPDWILHCIHSEVTQDPRFSNYNLRIPRHHEVG